jgi:hypothetical protein
VGLAAHRWWQTIRGKRTPSPAWAARFGRALLTFHFVGIGWIFFRASNLDTARDIFNQISSGTISFVNITPSFVGVALIALFAHFVPKHWYDTGLRLYCQSPYYAQAAAIAALVIAIRYAAGASSAPFIYSRF